MTDDLQKAQQEDLSSTPDSAQIDTQYKISKKNILIIVGVAVVILCLCSIPIVSFYGTSLYNAYIEVPPMEYVLDSYMQFMVNKDAESAYTLFSPRAQRLTPISELEKMLNDNHDSYFEGYQSLKITNLTYSNSTFSFTGLPQGTIANVTGNILYQGDIQGSFNGSLVKVDGKWMIESIQIKKAE